MTSKRNPLAELAETLAKSLLIGQIARAKETIGQGSLTQEQRQQLAALAPSELINESAMCAAAVQLWQQNEATAFTRRMIEDEERKRRGLDNIPKLLQ